MHVRQTNVTLLHDPNFCYVHFPSPWQIFLDCNAWMQWRIPYFNSASYGMAATLSSAISALTALYFIGSAVRAQRYLTNGNDQNSGVANVANKAAMRRLMRRVLASGCLMLLLTIILAIATSFILNPVGFTVFFGASYPVIMANSLLQIASFAPPAGAPSGPIEEVRLALKRAARSAVSRCNGSARAQSQRAGHKRLRFLIEEGPQPVIGGSGGRRRSSIFPRTINEQSIAVVPEEPTTTGPSQNSVPPCERLGVSYEFLLAISESWAVPSSMTTHEFCSKYIVPATMKKNCCLTDLLLQTNCPDEWLGKMGVFVSHW